MYVYKTKDKAVSALTRVIKDELELEKAIEEIATKDATIHDGEMYLVDTVGLFFI
tara:strand:- start:233 stop:397 length:165 start_codon:yes stop_codon:yes gene_type:complete